MQHTAGNYEAFARPRPARHAHETKAYIVGSGLAGLAAAVFLLAVPLFEIIDLAQAEGWLRVIARLP